jgi:hypothetical protein
VEKIRACIICKCQYIGLVQGSGGALKLRNLEGSRSLRSAEGSTAGFVEKASPPKKWGPRAAGRLDADEYCITLSFHWNVLRDRWWRYSFYLVNKVNVFALGIHAFVCRVNNFGVTGLTKT